MRLAKMIESYTEAEEKMNAVGVVIPEIEDDNVEKETASVVVPTKISYETGVEKSNTNER